MINNTLNVSVESSNLGDTRQPDTSAALVTLYRTRMQLPTPQRPPGSLGLRAGCSRRPSGRRCRVASGRCEQGPGLEPGPSRAGPRDTAALQAAPAPRTGYGPPADQSCDFRRTAPAILEARVVRLPALRWRASRGSLRTEDEAAGRTEDEEVENKDEIRPQRCQAGVRVRHGHR